MIKKQVQKQYSGTPDPDGIKGDQFQKRIAFSEFVSLVAMMMALVAFAINMILPAFKDMAEDLAIQNQNTIQLTVSLLYLGLALGQAVYGPLSDTIGRKPSIYLGFGLFMIGCIVSVSAHAPITLIAGQIIQGVGLGSPRIVSLAIVRDNFEGDGMGRVMSFIMLVFIIAPTISPALGQGILLLAGWRFIFVVFMVLVSLMFIWVKTRLPETLPKDARTTLSPTTIGQNFLEVLKNRQALGHTISLGLSSAAFIGYLNLSPQIFQGQYNLGQRYPLYFAVLSLSLGVALLFNSRLVMRFGMGNMSKWALWINCLGSFGFCILAWATSGHPPFWTLMTFMMLALFCFGILVGNLNAMAMKPLGHIAGMGAAIVGSLSTTISVPLAILMGNSYSGSIYPLATGFAIFGAMALAIYKWTGKNKNTQRR